MKITVFKKKLAITSLLALFMLSGQAQIRQNKKISSKAAISANANTLSKVKIESLKASQFNKNIQLEKLLKLDISEKDLKARSNKSVKISPSKPFVPGLDISFHGRYSKDYFRLLPKSATGLEPLAQLIVSDEVYNQIFLFSADITCNVRRGKEYRVIIKTNLERDGIVVVHMGHTSYYIEALKAENELAFVFWSQQAGYMTLSISPLLESTYKPYKIHSLPIKSIRVDEI
ncbi:hypothetical protein [Hwangdonia lutea]|uniref:Uncharacterized protein n=1 Tax=Hwangdonia lutea TaxID=3075823 RepID=A0AA97ELU6_9FLAO|nr:hypothetical protein [Hwangdonia sp. SCSIO 19198]WOD43522.1 hypothetical protein RNZ46_16155 [Hwangdonia sp. SCSIO 19198]